MAELEDSNSKRNRIKLKDFSKLTDISIYNISKIAKRNGVNIGIYPDTYFEIEELQNLLPFLELNTDIQIIENKLNNYKEESYEINQLVMEKPIFSIGKILFFDYTKNNFGFVSEVKNNDNLSPEKVFLHINNVTTKEILNDNEYICFFLDQNHKGYYAKKAKKIQEIENWEKIKIISFSNQKVFEIILDDLLNNDKSLIYNEIDKIAPYIINNLNYRNWYYVKQIGVESLIRKVIPLISVNSDDIKLGYLNIAFDSELLQAILDSWDFQNQDYTLKLFELIDINNSLTEEIKHLVKNRLIKKLNNISNQYFVELFKKSFLKESINEYKNIYKQLDGGQLFELFEASGDKDILYELIRKIDFNNRISKKYIEYIINLNDHDLMIFLEDQFISKINSISNYNVISLISDFQNFKELFFKNEKAIMHDFSSSELKEIIEFNPTNNFIIRYINILDLTNYKLDESLDFLRSLKLTKKECKTLQNKLVQDIEKLSSHTILKIYFNYSSLFDMKDLTVLIGCVNDNYVIFKILEYSIENNKSVDVKIILDNLKLTNYDELIKFYKIISANNSDKLLDIIESITNETFKEFLIFLLKFENFRYSNAFKSFVDSNRIFIQPFIFKAYIFYFYNKRLTKNSLLKELSNIEWLDISTILLKSFIELKDYSEKFVLENLSEIFKKHFNILNNQINDRKELIHFFSLKHILNSCNGRKQYDAHFWQSNKQNQYGTKISRWYIKGNSPSIIQRTVESSSFGVIFCEGQAWKQEPLWNSDTNQPTKEKYNFYFCRGSHCAELASNYDLSKPFYEWNLYEIEKIFNLKVEKYVFTKLAGWANRMNEIINLLQCSNCNGILRPVAFRPKSLGFYAVPLFHCLNPNCSEYKKEIRFTHCLNGNCNNMLDSRKCERCCPTGLICDKCGTKCPNCSCSNTFVKRTVEWYGE